MVIHTIAYSTVAIQELNLAFYYDPIYWDTACLIVDSGGLEDDDDDNDELFQINESDESIDETDETDSDEDSSAKKKAAKTIQYGKISSAIGKMKSFGVSVELPDINSSGFTFVPDVENQTIIYGLKGISKINTEFAKEIINNRPYTSWDDFNARVKTTKLQMINLIKCGVFDKISGMRRENLLYKYVVSVADTKKKLTLANMPTLISRGLVPPQYKDVERVFNFNRFLKKNCKKGLNYYLDDYSLGFYNEVFGVDDVIVDEDGDSCINQKKWDKKYKVYMDVIRPWLNNPETLQKLNNDIINELWDKYCEGYIPKWEMDSVGFYSGAHELDGLSFGMREIVDFSRLPEEPIIDKSFQSKEGRSIPIYRLFSIAGTVIEKNKLKNTVTLLTQYGVVKIKVYKSQFVKFDRQAFTKDEITGKKTITEKSWFSRGNKLLIQGIRRGDFFIPKAYKGSEYKPITLISSIDYSTGKVTYKTDRED